MEVTASNGRLILKEYPFIKRFMNDSVHWFKVERVDLDLMQSIPYTAWYSVLGIKSDYRSLAYYVFGRDGTLLATVKQADASRAAPFSLLSPKTWPRRIVPGETVGSAIDKLDEPNEVVFVVEVINIPSHYVEAAFIDTHISEWTSIVLHKLPARCLFSQYITELHNKFRKKIRAELV